MARKDRVPNPPKRPVQAPQRRSTPTTGADAERQRRLLYIIAGSGLAALVVVLGLLFLGGGGGKSEVAVLQDAGCTLKSYEAMANTPDHSDVPTLETKPKWNSFPPTSGPHFGQTAIFGSYDEPVPLVQTLHNLEHGAVVIQYGRRVTPAEVTRMTDWYRDDPNGIIIAPLPELGRTIALAAWNSESSGPGETAENAEGILARCTRFSEEAFDSFMDGYAFKGPERFRKEDLAAGS